MSPQTLPFCFLPSQLKVRCCCCWASSFAYGINDWHLLHSLYFFISVPPLLCQIGTDLLQKSTFVIRDADRDVIFFLLNQIISDKRI